MKMKCENQLILAPLAGYTDLPMRLSAKRLGCFFSYTEMVSTKGLMYGDVSRKLLESEREEQPLGVQIFGSEPAVMADAAKWIEREYPDIFSMIDINMGCPAPKIVKNGEGSALLKNLPLAKQVMESVVDATTLPVSVKTRCGWDEAQDVVEEIATIASNAGVAHLTMHGRTKAQGYGGKADWDCVARAKKVATIPVIGNGDVQSLEHAKQLQEQSGCDAVMVGRAAIGNPWIFAGYMPQMQERYDVAKEHLRMQVALRGEVYAVPLMRKHFSAYLKGITGAASFRKAIFAAKTEKELLHALQDAMAEKEHAN